MNSSQIDSLLDELIHNAHLLYECENSHELTSLEREQDRLLNTLLIMTSRF